MFSILISFLGFGVFLCLEYYAFKNYSPFKAFLIVAGSLTAVGGITFAFTSPAPTAHIQEKYTPASSKNITDNSYYVPMTVAIRQNEIMLSDFHTKQWDDGNYLWILTGAIENNSELPLNSLELELKLADCGRTGKKGDCLSAKSIFVTISDLNIKPHEKGQFDTTYAISDLTHKYRINAIFKEAYNVTQEAPRYAQQTYQAPDIDMKKITEQYPNVDRMVICGGGASVDRIKKEKINNGRTMLAENETQKNTNYGGC